MSEKSAENTPQKSPDEMLEDGPEGFNPRDFGWALVIEQADVTRNSEIRELIEEWRATAHETRHKTVRQGKLLHHLADEVEKVIEE